MFKKKEETLRPIEIPPCKHKYVDFPMYETSSYEIQSHIGEINIYQPYVCVHCKRREDKKMGYYRETFTKDGSNRFNEWVDEMKKRFNLVEKILVEDMVTDFQLVDREYIEVCRALYPDTFKHLDKQTSDKASDKTSDKTSDKD